MHEVENFAKELAGKQTFDCTTPSGVSPVVFNTDRLASEFGKIIFATMEATNDHIFDDSYTQCGVLHNGKLETHLSEKCRADICQRVQNKLG